MEKYQDILEGITQIMDQKQVYGKKQVRIIVEKDCRGGRVGGRGFIKLTQCKFKMKIYGKGAYEGKKDQKVGRMRQRVQQLQVGENQKSGQNWIKGLNCDQISRLQS
ncbi:unnamed protein product [Paramecium sonneborni]|uniref:Uncharacterized protein n=1 Tax=Paramecium sonneborni TaxID=65129 RepID=A0A8S1RMA4_9CILI|nr:unnamed protein product [Paramecium sonneborni]